MEELTWEIGTYDEQDKKDVLNIIRDQYGDVDLAQEVYYDWVTRKKPAEFDQRVAREKKTGKILNSGISVGVPAVWRGQEIRVLLGFNIVVDPRYRRQGIHTTLSNLAREDVQEAGYRFTILFPNQQSMTQAIKARNHYLISQVPLMIRPLDIQALTARYVGHALLRWGLNLSWAIAGRTLWRERLPQTDPDVHLVAEGKELDESYDRFWANVKQKYDLMVVRDRDFLQWRFCDIPTRDYQILSVRRDGEMEGYLVLREAEIRGTPTGMISDFLVLPGARGDKAGLRLLHEAIQRFRDAHVALTGGLVLPHTQEYQIMRRAGFLDAPERFAPQPFYLFVRTYSDEPPLDVVKRPGSWYVSIADHDAV